jgi:hypothetical protein
MHKTILLPAFMAFAVSARPVKELDQSEEQKASDNSTS